MTDALCRDGIARVARSLARACADGHDAAARADMALASLFGGIALANAGLGAVHGLAAPIGGMCRRGARRRVRGAPPPRHGRQCPGAAAAAEARASPLGAPTRSDACCSDGGRGDADAAVRWLRNTVERLGVPRLGELGVRAADLPAIADQAQRSSSMKGNPVALGVGRADPHPRGRALRPVSAWTADLHDQPVMLLVSRPSADARAEHLLAHVREQQAAARQCGPVRVECPVVQMVRRRAFVSEALADEEIGAG